MDKFIEALQLAQNQEVDKAYNMLSSILEEQPMNFDARYARAMIDISQIKKHSLTTINDLKLLISKKTKYTKPAFTFLALVYDGLDDIDNVIIYGEEALKKDSPFKDEVCFAIARAYARKESEPALIKALEYINMCVDMEDTEDELNYYICKADILTSLKRLDEASETLDKIASTFGYSAVFYYIKARIAMAYYSASKSEDDLDSVIDNATITLQYEEKDVLAKTLLIEAYTLKKDFNKALEIIDTLKDTLTDEELAIEKIKVYDELNDYQKCFDIIENALVNNTESWRLHYMKGVFFIEMDESDENLEKALVCFKEAYNYFSNVNILRDILKINKALKKEQDNYEYLKSLLEKSNKGEICYYLADAANRIGKPHEEINRYYETAKNEGYVDEIEFMDYVCNFTEDPNFYNKEIKKYVKKYSNKLYVWSKKKMAVRYIYGENGFKINYKKAEKYMQECLKEESDDSCVNSLYGRLQELKRNYNLAFVHYKKAYDILKVSKVIDCDCSYGYYAHALFNGIGCEENTEEAKLAILEAINRMGKFTCSHVVCYYAYFYLSDDERFTLDKTLELLEFNYPFYRYDISRIVYLTKVLEKVNKKSSKLDELLKDNLKYYSKDEIKYYNNSIKEPLPKPYWKNI